MKLWLLTLNDFEKYGTWDVACGFVIRAKDEQSARSMIKPNQFGEDFTGGDEIERFDYNPWLDPNESTCEQITKKGKAEIIIRDYNAG